MTPRALIDQLAVNAGVFSAVLDDVPHELVVWKPSESDWCLLEIACHLLDEEREDFRARVESTLADPERSLTPVDPQGWVLSRDYAHQNFREVVRSFLDGAASVQWLRSLNQPAWRNTFHHANLGPLSAKLFLENWLAHDYLHLRQINRRKYEHLEARAEHPLDYAGDW